MEIRKPDWLKVRAPGGDKYVETKNKLRRLRLFTVCEQARCPNMGECWASGTATIMLLGEVCTRACKFCAVKTGRPNGLVDIQEPAKVSALVASSGLEYVVLTTVDRDDLPDGGAAHIADTIRLIKKKSAILIEALVGDFRGNLQQVKTVVCSGVDVYAHNIETVRRLQPFVRDPRAGYDQSIETLRAAKEFGGKSCGKIVTKTSIQLGHGERDEEIEQALKDLRAANVDVVTFGQYLQPSPKHLPVTEFVSPVKFKTWEERALKIGFVYVMSGPLVRSSYKAGEFFLENMIKNNRRQFTWN